MFKHPFSFSGRIRRKEYALSFLVYFVVIFTLAGSLAEIGDGTLLNFFGLLFIPLAWFLWAQGAKRCHDVGHSGWWLFIPLYSIILLFEEGHPGRNEYGANPKGIGMHEEQEEDQKNLF